MRGEIIAMCGSDRQEYSLPKLREFIRALDNDGYDVRFSECFSSYLRASGIAIDASKVEKEVPDGASRVVSVGGDGTFLRTVEWLGKRSIPMVGINTGHLGYLAGFSFDRFEEALAAAEGKYDISERITLSIECNEMPKGVYPHVLNEVAVLKGDTTSMVNIRAYVNGNYLAEYLADGLVVSTPTGSTAYNLSCGGPIVEPTADSIILTPIAPHSLTLRPIVISGASVVELEINSRGKECHVAFDGRAFAVPANGARLRIAKGGVRVMVAQPVESNFASVLRAKLAWGQR